MTLYYRARKQTNKLGLLAYLNHTLHEIRQTYGFVPKYLRHSNVENMFELLEAESVGDGHRGVPNPLWIQGTALLGQLGACLLQYHCRHLTVGVLQSGIRRVHYGVCLSQRNQRHETGLQETPLCERNPSHCGEIIYSQ